MTVDSNLEAQSRIDLAAAFRLAERFGWHEAVANHFSLWRRLRTAASS